MIITEELFRNGEHYPDPTACEAICTVIQEEKADKEQAPPPHRKKRPLVFICSPYRGAIEHNLRLARKYCRLALKRKAVPFAPHLHFTQFLDDTVNKERNIGISCGLEMLRRCDQIWVCGDKITAGMKAEIRAAKDLGIPIRRIKNNTKGAKIQ
jgi:hypothetical protein